jgi:hypothetical protein
VAHCLKNVSRQLMFAGQFLEFGKFTFHSADLGPALHNEIHQPTDQKISLGTEALLLAFVQYPLIPEDLEDLADLPEDLPREARRLCSLWRRRS